MSSELFYQHETDTRDNNKMIQFIDLCEMDDSLSDLEEEPIGINFNASEFGLMSVHSRDTFYQHFDIAAAVNDNLSDQVNDNVNDNISDQVNENGSPAAGPSHKLRRNPRRANSIPIDYRCTSTIEGIPESPIGEGEEMPEEGEDVDVVPVPVKRRKFLQAKRTTLTGCPAKTKKSNRKQRLSADSPGVGAVFSPPSPVSRLPRRTWPVEGMHSRPVWPDASYTLPEPKPSREDRQANIMHRVLHAVLDYARMRRDRVTQFCLLDEKIKYIEQQLFKLTHGDAADLSDEDYNVDSDVSSPTIEIPLMCAKIRYVIVLLQKWSLEGDVTRIMRYKPLTPETSTQGVRLPKKGEVAMLYEADNCIVLEEADEGTLLEALLCVTSDLYCLTNHVTPDMLSQYLDALSKGQQQ